MTGLDEVLAGDGQRNIDGDNTGTGTDAEGYHLMHLPTLAEKIGPMGKGFYLVGGPPGIGKTALLLNLFLDLVENNQDVKCVFLLFKDTVERVLNRIYSYYSGVGTEDIENDRLNDRSIKSLADCKSKIKELFFANRLDILEAHGEENLKAIIRKETKKNKRLIFFIDSMELFEKEFAKGSIKQLADNFDVTILGAITVEGVNTDSCITDFETQHPFTTGWDAFILLNPVDNGEILPVGDEESILVAYPANEGMTQFNVSLRLRLNKKKSKITEMEKEIADKSLKSYFFNELPEDDNVGTSPLTALKKDFLEEDSSTHAQQLPDIDDVSEYIENPESIPVINEESTKLDFDRYQEEEIDVTISIKSMLKTVERAATGNDQDPVCENVNEMDFENTNESIAEETSEKPGEKKLSESILPENELKKAKNGKMDDEIADLTGNHNEEDEAELDEVITGLDLEKEDGEFPSHSVPPEHLPLDRHEEEDSGIQAGESNINEDEIEFVDPKDAPVPPGSGSRHFNTQFQLSVDDSKEKKPGGKNPMTKVWLLILLIVLLVVVLNKDKFLPAWMLGYDADGKHVPGEIAPIQKNTKNENSAAKDDSVPQKQPISSPEQSQLQEQTDPQAQLQPEKQLVENSQEESVKQPQETTGTSLNDEKKPLVSKPMSLPEPPQEEIVLVQNPVLGISWKAEDNGFRIVSVGKGPAGKAGLRVGDVLTEVDGNPLKSTGMLRSACNDVFMGKRKSAILKIGRHEKTYSCKIIRDWDAVFSPSNGMGKDSALKKKPNGER